MSSKHLSRVIISDKEFFYTSRVNPKKREADSYNKFSLFTIKFIKSGADSDDILSLRNVQPSHCFEIITEDRLVIVFISQLFYYFFSILWQREREK